MSESWSYGSDRLDDIESGAGLDARYLDSQTRERDGPGPVTPLPRGREDEDTGLHVAMLDSDTEGTRWIESDTVASLDEWE